MIRLAHGPHERLPIPSYYPIIHSPPSGARRSWGWLLFWLSVFSILGVSVASGVLLLTKLPPPVDCQHISPLSADGDRLHCAQLAAEAGKLEPLVGAITLVENWSSDHSLYPEAQRLLSEWSKTLLQIARTTIEQGNHSQAVNIASKIPANSPLYSEAQAAVAGWNAEWQQGEDITRQFKDALVTQNWQQASQLIAALSKFQRDYWSVSRVNTLMRQMAAEKQAWQQLQEARELAKTNRLEQLTAAITLAAQVNPNSFVKAKAQAEQSSWSRTLVLIAAAYFEQQDFVNAVKVLERIPLNTPQYNEAQDWIRLSRASQTVKQNTIIALVDALAAVRQIDSKSPIYKKAAQYAAQWQLQLQDLMQLQAAQIFASSEQRDGLELAIDQAARIAPGRPQRLKAQTLIAHWRKQNQQVEDRHHLSAAQQIAQQGTLAALKAAVARASQIQLGQPLRISAQTAIAGWNRQIQTLEDQPILDLAQTHAQRQDWRAAIATASSIRPGRALYPQAQQAITRWVTQVQIIQDRPILEAAMALAAQGRLDAAMAMAAQIAPERALYKQAQAAIVRWQSLNVTSVPN